MSAKDKATGKEQKIRIEASSGISDKDIDKMVKEAESHASDDKKRRETIEQRNRLDAMVYDVEKNSKEWSDRLEASLKEKLDKAVEGAKAALRTGEPDGIRKASEELQAAYSEAGRSLYSQAQSSGGAGEPSAEPGSAAPGGTAGGEAKKEDVVEADYEIVDEKKE
ncbi:MAG: hypothetical protein A2085_01785 [Gemmatimonadetes bacterium GWC2_71_10]|nr:MAG: hypothetical protein A2085_01785 [Gemmatimonadetes bacterium GWC2_71_10]